METLSEHLEKMYTEAYKEQEKRMRNAVGKLYKKIMGNYLNFYAEVHGYDRLAKEDSEMMSYAQKQYEDFIEYEAANASHIIDEKLQKTNLTFGKIEEWLDSKAKPKFECKLFQYLFDIKPVALMELEGLNELEIGEAIKKVKTTKVSKAKQKQLTDNCYFAVICKLLLDGGLDLGLKRAMIFHFGVLRRYSKFDFANIYDDPELACLDAEQKLHLNPQTK